MNEIRDPQILSAILAGQLQQSLLCYKGYISAGSKICNLARQNLDSTLPEIGRGDDTIAQLDQRFATVCETCPVLLAAFTQVFGK